MAVHKLENYLKTYRKRAGISQKEMGYLLGAHDGAEASRYEHFKRMPSLETALFYEAVFQAPVSELFAGVYEKAERAAARRAKLLRKRLGTNGKSSDRKIKLLAEMAQGRRSKK